jgi:HlyD family secretion protein
MQNPPQKKSLKSLARQLTFWFCLIAIPVSAAIWGVSHIWARPELPPELSEVEQVHKVRYDRFVNAPGEIQSANNTIVECEIENIQVRVMGNSINAGASTRILTIIPDGSKVKKGDVLCKLDSREFEEMVRLQKINVERAKADKLQAEMELEVAKIAIEEYRKGMALQQIQNLKGRIALAQTDSSRFAARLEWSQKMLEKGYISKSALMTDQMSLQRSDIALTQAEIQLNTYEKFSMPKQIHQLQTQITTLETNLTLENERYQRYLDRLKLYEKQIDNCTVRAPHDGLAVYANEEDGDTRIEEGSSVRQGQDIFVLPDLTDMQVMAKLSESIVQKVQPGMKVRILVESVFNKSMMGTVERIAQLPIASSSWRSSNEVKQYYCIVKVDDEPEDMRPGLNAEIQVLTDAPEEKLTITPDVVEIEGGREFCLVMSDDGEIEKREIRTRTGDPQTLEVLDGLNEGENVLRHPDKILEHKAFVTRQTNLDEFRTQPALSQTVESEKSDDAHLAGTTDSTTAETSASATARTGY